MRFLFLTIATAFAFGCGCHTNAQDVISLFNGVDLTGWSQLGGSATYHVEDEEIVGRSVPDSPNSFLVTESPYDDFVLELDFWIDDPEFNSGVQIRSQSLSTHNNGRVFGYQVEIDPSDRAWTGGLYFEGGSPQRAAGWLDDLSDDSTARQAFLLGEWNHFRIEALGPRIRTWVNDTPAVDFIDTDAEALLTSGFVGLQVHSVGAVVEPKEVRFRNLLLTPITPASLIDFTGDGIVDAGDYTILMQSMYVTPLGDLPGDLTGDAFVDFDDHRVFKNLFEEIHGEGAFASMTVIAPEPMSFSLTVCVLACRFVACSSMLGVSFGSRCCGPFAA